MGQYGIPQKKPGLTGFFNGHNPEIILLQSESHEPSHDSAGNTGLFDDILHNQLVVLRELLLD
jgi:hypothetical protein